MSGNKIYSLPNGGNAFRALKPHTLTPEQLDEHAQYANERVQSLMASRRQRIAYKRPTVAEAVAFLAGRKTAKTQS